MGQSKQNMIFRKLGGKYQLQIASPEDLRFILKLDESHWIATSAPLESFTCDKKFLKYLDSDSNNRIRTDELKDALTWLFSIINDINILSEKSSSLKLNDINTDNETGKQIKISAERILANLKAEDKSIIHLEQTRSNQQILSSGKCNGDGVIPVASLKDEKTAKMVTDIMSTIGTADDASGNKGITAELLDKFMVATNAYIEWFDQGTLTKDETSTPVMIRGKETVTAYAAIKVVKNKLDEYFNHCQMLQIDEVIEKRFHPDEKTVAELNINSSEAMAAYMASAPLNKPNKDLILHLDENINPTFKTAIDNFAAKVLKLKANKKVKQLTFTEWAAIKTEFANFAKWDSGKQGEIVEPLGIDVLRKYAKGQQSKRLKPLFEKDLAVAEEIKQIANVEKLQLLKQSILDFANDFVSLSRLFDPSLDSMIQVGTLILDGRHFDLNVFIKDLNEHKKIAIKSNICVMYITCTSKTGENVTKINVATGVTSGNITNLYVGKKGIFFTPDGKEWDAEVMDFIQHPVSISEALRMPFVKLGEFFKKQTERFTTTGYSTLEKGIGEGINNVEKTVATPQPQPAKTSWTGPLMLLGGGIGIAGVGSAFASITNALKNISLMQILLFFLIIILIVALPILISAFIKLRKRNIGMFLEACGWAMNSPIRLTHKMGLLFTRTPSFPDGSRKIYFDQAKVLLKNADIQKRSWTFKLLIIMITLLVAIGTGYICRKIFKVDEKVSDVVTGAPGRVEDVKR